MDPKINIVIYQIKFLTLFSYYRDGAWIICSKFLNSIIFKVLESAGYTRGNKKVLRQILKKKNSEYGNQIESCKFSHLIWLPYSEGFF